MENLSELKETHYSMALHMSLGLVQQSCVQQYLEVFKNWSITMGFMVVVFRSFLHKVFPWYSGWAMVQSKGTLCLPVCRNVAKD